MYGMTPIGVFFTAIFPLEVNEQALCQQPQVETYFDRRQKQGGAAKLPRPVQDRSFNSPYCGT